ncbi:hypothetical protein MP638_001582 [Amoeboaphelidium occidentale]|nr:hypothetical protein MP638_001582 [Amoeboaphelidium occidentale]
MSFVGVNDAEAYVTYDDVGNTNDMADSDIALEELEERSDYEDEDENPDRPENKHYDPYRDFHINLNTENPKTGRAWTKKDYNKAFNDFIEKEAWQVEPPLRREELKYDRVAPGPVGTELNELAVLERFFTPALVETISRKDIGELAKSTMTNECFWKWVLIKLQLAYYNLADTASAWSTKQLENIPSFSKIISRNRYQYLDSIIRCSYDTDTDDKDPLGKCRRIIDSLNKTFCNSYNLKRNISIDESLLRYSGNHSLKRYIPNKAAHFGFKYYAVADSDTGYVYRLLFDMGAKTKINSDCPETLSKPGKIVWTLLQGMTPSHPPLLNKGHLLATDNFYTCFYLFFALRKHGTDCIGTVRKNRASLPKSFLKKKWSQSEIESHSRMTLYCDSFYLMNWVDRKPVIILSSVSSAETIDDTQKKKHANSTETKSVPDCIGIYNKAMPGVDLNDQKKFGRSVAQRRIKKFHRTIFNHLMDTTLINSYVYWERAPVNKDKNITHVDFRDALAAQLFAKYCSHNDVQVSSKAASIDEPLLEEYNRSHIAIIHPKRQACQYCQDNPEQANKKKRRLSKTITPPALEILNDPDTEAIGPNDDHAESAESKSSKVAPNRIKTYYYQYMWVSSIIAVILYGVTVITSGIALVRLKQLLIGPLATTMRVALVILALCGLQNLFSLLDVIPLALTQFLYLFPLTSLLSFCLYLFLDVLSMVPDQLRDYSNAQSIWVLDQLSRPVWKYLTLIMMSPSVIVLGGLFNTASEDLAFLLQFSAVICVLVLMSLSIFAMFYGRALIVKLLDDLKKARAVLRATQPQATPPPKTTSNGQP